MCPLDWTDVSGAAARAPLPAVHTSEEALLEGLNEPQRAAVVHGEGPLLILAGAGSGKTRVITRRVGWLLAAHGVRPHEVLAITFTNKAAREMRERVAALVPLPGLWISTFHSMCARILRREIEVLGPWTRDFTIYDTYDKNQLLKELVKDAGYDVQRFRPYAIGSWISDWKNAGLEQGLELRAEALDMDGEVFDTVRKRYTAALERNNALDFDDLQLKVLEIFERHPGVRGAYSTRFRQVMVDEYQDTNRVQYLLTQHLSGAHGNLAVCGDPDQSIYAWRGADVRNILDFERDYPGALVVKLEQNYRSTGNILAAAQAVIRNNVGRKEKELWTEQPAGARIGIVQCADENDEADEVVHQIRGALAEGKKPDEIAVFYRVNFMQRALERSLRLGGIPYQIVGGVEFFQRREIRDVIAYLRLLVNPADDVSFKRVVNVPGRGVGDKSLEQLVAWAAERQMPLSRAAADPEARAGIRGRAKAGIASFAALLAELDALGSAPAAVALDRVLLETRYLEHLRELGDPDQQAREENVQELRANAESYDKENPEAGLRGFLQDIALVSDVDGYDEGQPRVTLMTLHSAKGLEFPVVLIAGMEEELIPHARALEEGGNDGLEEERRLVYVGITRARERIALLHAQSRWHFGSQAPRLPSRFLQEIPDELVEGGSSEGEREEEDVLGVFDDAAAPKGLAVGAWVEHPHFGRGQVDRLSGSGVNARAAIRFTRHGVKHLLLTYAKLTVVGASR